MENVKIEICSTYKRAAAVFFIRTRFTELKARKVFVVAYETLRPVFLFRTFSLLCIAFLFRQVSLSVRFIASVPRTLQSQPKEEWT